MKSQMSRLGFWPLTTKNPSHQLQLIDEPVTHAGWSLILSSSNHFSQCWPLVIYEWIFSIRVQFCIILTHSVFFPFPYSYPVISQTHPCTQPTAPLTHALFSLMPLVKSSEAVTNQCQVDMPICQWQPLCRWQTGCRKRSSRCRREGSIKGGLIIVKRRPGDDRMCLFF